MNHPTPTAASTTTERAAAAAAEAAERAIRGAQLRAAHPELTPVSATNKSRVAAAKNIRRQLAARFPRVKFTVRGSSYAGGDSIHVGWTDGPTVEQVDDILREYRAGSFDSWSECYEYSRNPWSETFGSAKYITTTREFGDALISRVLARLHRYWCEPDTPVPTVADYRTGKLLNYPSRSSDFHREVNNALCRHTFCA